MRDSKKHPYESGYGGGQITAAQFLAEMMCVRLAAKEGTQLPVKFWNLDRWKKTFLLQVRQANALLKIYDSRAIIKALRNPKALSIYSLGAPFLDQYIQEEQRNLTMQLSKPAKVLETVNTNIQPQNEITPKTKLGKLRLLD